MSTNKHFFAVCAVVLALALVVTVLFMNGEKLGIRVVRDEDAEGNESSQYFTSNDQNTDWTATTTITLNGDTATVSGPGAYANGGSVTISAAGYYEKWDEYLPTVIRDLVQVPTTRTSAFSKYAACRMYG